MTVDFTTNARDEWIEAVDYYNEQRAGLGYEFVLEVDRAIERVIQFPEADRIVVTAVMNLRKKP